MNQCKQPLQHPSSTHPKGFLCTLPIDGHQQHEASAATYGVLARWVDVPASMLAGQLGTRSTVRVVFDLYGQLAPSSITGLEAVRFLLALEVSRGGLDPASVELPQFDYLVVGALFAGTPDQVASMELAVPGYVQAYRWVTENRAIGMNLLAAIASGPY